MMASHLDELGDVCDSMSFFESSLSGHGSGSLVELLASVFAKLTPSLLGVLAGIIVEACPVDKLVDDLIIFFSCIILPLLMLSFEEVSVGSVRLDDVKLSLNELLDGFFLGRWKGVAMHGEDNFINGRNQFSTASDKGNNDGVRT